jgi:hypothetical protein
MRYSDMEYLSKFLIDPEFDDLVLHEDWEDSVSLELLANEDALDPGESFFDDNADR